MEVTVPANQRTNNNRAAFLVSLTAEEREAVLVDGGLPGDKLEVPPSWKKQPIPSVPDGKPDAIETVAA